jgi:hypothetical protein
MSNYTKSTNFAVKDTLPTGDPAKVIKGTEFNVEFDNIATASATKANLNNSALTGTTVIATASVTGNITVGGTVDGRDVAADGTKLDTIENNATADQTAAQIKTAYEDNANTNAFNDAAVTKLGTIEASADVTDVTNVTAAGAVMDSELTNITAVKALDQGLATTDNPTFAALTSSGNIVVGGTVDGRDVAADGTQLDDNTTTLAGLTAPAASAVTYDNAASGLAATEAQAAIDEIVVEKAALAGADFTGQATSTAGDFNLVVNTTLADAAATLTAAQLTGGEFTITPTAARIQTLDTAANIISALSGSVDGSNFTFIIVNLAAFDVTIATATGVTLIDNMVINNGVGTFRVRRTSGTTVSVTRLESASSASQIMTVRDEKSSGTGGGTFNSGAWRTRDLNTVTNNTITGASLASDQITLLAGRYKFSISAPARRVDANVIKLANITDTSDALIGSAADTETGAGDPSRSFIEDELTIAGTKVFEIQHRCVTSRSNGFGVPVGVGVVEVYTMITIEKIG